MKVTVVHNKSEIPKKNYSLYDKYIKFLNRHYPLKHDTKLFFLGEKLKKMTTGSSNDKKNEIFVLTKNRMTRDVLRTLSHEWVHQYQTQILGRKKDMDIGGKNENEANAIAGILIKKFEKENSSDEPKMYDDNEKTSRKSRTNSQSNKRDRDKGK